MENRELTEMLNVRIPVKMWRKLHDYGDAVYGERGVSELVRHIIASYFTEQRQINKDKSG